MRVGDITKYFDNLLQYSCDDAYILGAEIDSRKVDRGNIFFAYKGSKLDGNLFAQEALNFGASVAVMDNEEEYDKVVGNKVLVEDTMHALNSMGLKRLEEYKGKKVAVTGSYGKTTTKELLKLILSEKYRVESSKANYNNELGVLTTACGLSPSSDIAIFELGSNSCGELEILGNLVKPDINVVTGAGRAHVGRFASIEGVINEKISIVNKSLCKTAIIHESLKSSVNESTTKSRLYTYGMDTSNYAYITEYSFDKDKLLFRAVVDGKRIDCSFGYPYLHIAVNFLSVLIAANIFNLDLNLVASKFSDYRMPSGRGNIIKYKDITIINDSYNSSPESLISAFRSLSNMTKAPKYAVIGPIAEIEGFENEIYKDIIREADTLKDINFIMAGDCYEGIDHGTNISNFSLESLSTAVQLIKNGVVLIKASRKYEFDKLIDLIKKVQNNAL